ncbi:hypothetical protein RB195_024219 [Necator americanus]|uniref:Uncharacterized protein n=1 Tax=Necator americanus TaxID=51031 RepID=A0ABR1EM99_NECAM
MPIQRLSCEITHHFTKVLGVDVLDDEVVNKRGRSPPLKMVGATNLFLASDDGDERAFKTQRQKSAEERIGNVKFGSWQK